MIFLMATAWLVSWSLAELRAHQYALLFLTDVDVPDKTKGSHAYRLQVSVSMRRQSLHPLNVGYGCRTCL
jgi:hypothetical protein